LNCNLTQAPLCGRRGEEKSGRMAENHLVGISKAILLGTLWSYNYIHFVRSQEPQRSDPLHPQTPSPPLCPKPGGTTKRSPNPKQVAETCKEVSNCILPIIKN
jgi:hypothetical protein